MPERAHERAADRLGGNAERLRDCPLLPADPGNQQIDHAPFGLGTVGTYPIQQACEPRSHVCDRAIVCRYRNTAGGGAGACRLHGKPRKFESVAGAIVRADRPQCPGESGNAQLTNSDANPESLLARSIQGRLQGVCGTLESTLNFVRIGLCEFNSGVELGELVEKRRQ